MLDSELLATRCALCHSKVTDCGCMLGKSPAVHAALERLRSASSSPQPDSEHDNR